MRDAVAALVRHPYAAGIVDGNRTGRMEWVARPINRSEVPGRTTHRRARIAELREGIGA